MLLVQKSLLTTISLEISVSVLASVVGITHDSSAVDYSIVDSSTGC